MNFKIPLFIAVLFLLWSCDEKENIDSMIFESYPVMVGNFWNYNREIIVKVYESETSDEVIDLITDYSSIKVLVAKDTIFHDTISVKKFVSSEEGTIYSSTLYMFIDSIGLKCYAYSNAGVNVFAKKARRLYTLADLSAIGFEGVNSAYTDGIVVESTPTLNLKLPLRNDSKWTYRQASESLSSQIDKEVDGYEIIEVNSKSFECYKVKYNYINSTFSDVLHITDWISKEGLIKRQTVFDRRTLLIADEDPFIGESVQITKTLILKDWNVN